MEGGPLGSLGGCESSGLLRAPAHSPQTDCVMVTALSRAVRASLPLRGDWKILHGEDVKPRRQF